VLAPLLAEYRAEKEEKKKKKKHHLRKSSSGGGRRGPRKPTRDEGVRLCVLNDARPFGCITTGRAARLGPRTGGEFGGFYTQSVFHVQPEYQNDRYDDTFDNYPPHQDKQSECMAAQGMRALMVQVPKALASAAIALLRAAASAPAAASAASSNDAAHPSGGAPPFAFRVVPVHASDDAAFSSPSASLSSSSSAAAAPRHPQRSCNFVRAIVTGSSNCPNNSNSNNSGRSAGPQDRVPRPGLRALVAPPWSLLKAARDKHEPSVACVAAPPHVPPPSPQGWRWW